MDPDNLHHAVTMASSQVANAILQRVGMGESLGSICQDNGHEDEDEDEDDENAFSMEPMDHSRCLPGNKPTGMANISDEKAFRIVEETPGNYYRVLDEPVEDRSSPFIWTDNTSG